MNIKSIQKYILIFLSITVLCIVSFITSNVYANSKNEKVSQFTTITPKNDILVYDDVGNIIATFKKNQEYIMESEIKKYYTVQHENYLGYIKKENVLIKKKVKVKYNTSKFTNKFITVPKHTQFKLVSNNKSYMIANQHRRYPIVNEDSKKYYVLVGKKLTYVNKSKATVDTGIPVLMYHHLLKNNENTKFKTTTTMDVELFEKQMKYLHDNKNITITPRDLELYLKGKKNLSTKAVLITFDDGYKSSLVYAVPIMKKYKLKATNFMITSRIKDNPTTFNSDSLQYLSKGEMKEASVVFNYASHTYDLHYVSKKTNSGVLKSASYNEIYKDLVKSKEITNEKYFVYPFGQYDGTALKVLKDLDYRLAFTIKNGYVKKGDKMLELNRITINNKVTMNEFKKIIKY